MTRSVTDFLSAVVGEAFAVCGLDPSFGLVTGADRPDLCQYQCNGAMPAAGRAKKKPRDVAEAVAAILRKNPIFADIAIAGPGFINVTLTDAWLADRANAALVDPRLGVPTTDAPRKVVVDFGGPNVAKPMHVGHLRSSIIGDCLQRLFRFVGDEVVSDIHLGDWGLQMGMLIAELARRRPELPYFDEAFAGPYPDEPPVSLADLEEMYPAASGRCKEDAVAMEEARKATFALQGGNPGYRAVWRHFVNVSVAALKRDFGSLGIAFDVWNGESAYHDRLTPFVNRYKAVGLAVESQGATVIDVTEPGDKKALPPLILVNSEGGFLYAATDLATLEERIVDMGARSILYVVDKRQGLHFTQVFRGAKKGIAGADAVELEHVDFGTMNGADGKPFKTRAGGVMKLSDLLAMVVEKAAARMEENHLAESYPPDERRAIAATVGLATLKYADLSNHRSSDYVFDLEKFSQFEGRTGPYLLYTAVRIKSILRKIGVAETGGERVAPPTEGVERDLTLQTLRLADVIAATLRQRAPHYLCEYLYDLAQAFSRFYQQCHIANEQDPVKKGAWLALSRLTLAELTLGLTLLGVDVPERM
jgi:arginyl-tRNA synthetase